MAYKYDPQIDLLFHYPTSGGQAYLVPLSVLGMCQPVAIVLSASRALDVEWTSQNAAPLVIDISIPVPAPSASALAEKIAAARHIGKEMVIIARIAPFTSDTSIPPHPTPTKYPWHIPTSM